MASPIVAPPELVRADYNIYRYTDEIYKVIRFRSTAVPTGKRDQSNFQHYQDKLDASLCRAKRVVLELALCNHWDYFCTFTISSGKHDRHNLIAWRDSFTQWIRDQRKKGYQIDYVLVPERHADGAWHAHGLFSTDVPLVSFSEERRQGLKVPDNLVDLGFFDWPAYREKFGWCSFGFIKNPVAAAFYIVKYLTKDQSRLVTDVGMHLYYCTQGLQRAELHSEIFGLCGYLDQFLEHHYDFCDVGMTKVKDGCDWSFALEYSSVEPLFVDSSASDEADFVTDLFDQISFL